jgi:hypothetical protein
LPSNSLKICEYGLPTMLASTLSLPRWGMPITTSSSACSAAWSIDGVHHRDDGFRTLEREPLLPNVFRLQERLERLGGIQLGQDVLLLRDRRLVVLDLDALLQPLLLFGLEDVGVLDADVAAVRVTQQDQARRAASCAGRLRSR